MLIDRSGIITRGRTLPSANKKRVLFYGACHASVFARIFETFCTDYSYSFDKITNYQIIRDKIPFPYESISEWDIIVFNPIFRYPGYETSRLIEECIKKNVKYVCYPYLEWRGYFPHIKEEYFINMPFLHYPIAVDLASKYENFDSYLVQFDKHFSEGDYIFENLEATSETLRQNEKLGDCNVIISDYIAREYRKQRLFLIPSHPSQVLYKEMIKRLSDEIDLPIDPSYLYSAAEPQEGVKVPIHPIVSTRLELNFQDADFQNNTSSFGNRTIPWSDYMRLSYGFGKGGTMWQANSPTAIKCVLGQTDELSLNEFIRIPKGTIFQARASSTSDLLHLSLDVTWADPEFRHKIMNWKDLYIYKNHWDETKIEN